MDVHSYVGFGGNCGRDVLALSFTGFDPERFIIRETKIVQLARTMRFMRFNRFRLSTISIPRITETLRL